jgi:hypothetical protein
MKYDNERDRNAHGHDAGTIVEGEVFFDYELGRYVLKDGDGVGFDPQAVLQGLEGKRARIVIVSFEAIENLERILQQSGRFSTDDSGVTTEVLPQEEPPDPKSQN